MANLLEIFVSLISRDNITLFLAIFGSIGSVSSWLYVFIKNRKNIDIRIIGQRFSGNHSLLVYMMLENKSRLPIAITGICIKINGIFYSCVEIPVTALKETIRCGKNVMSHHEYQSMPIPIFLPSLGGTSGYVYFEFPEVEFQPDSTHLNFRLTTNRGKAIEKTLSLGRYLD